jgi:hypothetical protein
MIEPEESLRMRPLAQAARSSRSPHRRLDLDAIERSLRGLQHEFERINETLTVPRDPLSDCVLENMMLGYRRVDRILADRIDLFALGSSGYLLELNALVLWGDDHRQREASRPSTFLQRRPGGRRGPVGLAGPDLRTVHLATRRQRLSAHAEPAPAVPGG